MHIWQAIKMACKSLWTNKLRSFLTMLGIIIGVVTVSLLTTVAQGVSDAVVSSIRSQSTLAVLMNMSNDMTYSSANQTISGVQSQLNKEDADYFEYSLVISSSSVVANTSLEGMSSENLDENFFSFNQPYHISDEEYNNLPEDQKQIADQLKVIKARKQALSSKIYAVDKNYADVYGLTIKGEFPKNTNEILVDEEFIGAYLGITLDEAINREVTLGVVVTTDVTINFETAQDESILTAIRTLFENFKIKINGEILMSDDAKSVKFNANFFRTMNEESIKNNLNSAFIQIGLTSVVTSAMLTDKYDLTNSKTYVISGVLSDEENSSLFGGMSMSENQSDGNLNAMSLMSASYETSKGTLYILADAENEAVLGLSETGIENSVISYAYFRYKTEDVMESSINKISSAFLPSLIVMRDYMLISMSSVANIISKVMDIMTTMLTVISVISLVVGGIGIMNIMLVAVSERTREIGIRKAIGAKRSSILVQFLIEALMLSLIGGLIGLTISAIGVAIISNLMGIAISMPLWVIGMSLGFCTAIGLIFGMFPAIKASHMQPIDALRRE